MTDDNSNKETENESNSSESDSSSGSRISFGSDSPGASRSTSDEPLSINIDPEPTPEDEPLTISIDPEPAPADEPVSISIEPEPAPVDEPISVSIEPEPEAEPEVTISSEPLSIEVPEEAPTAKPEDTPMPTIDEPVDEPEEQEDIQVSIDEPETTEESGGAGGGDDGGDDGGDGDDDDELGLVADGVDVSGLKGWIQLAIRIVKQDEDALRRVANTAAARNKGFLFAAIAGLCIGMGPVYAAAFAGAPGGELGKYFGKAFGMAIIVWPLFLVASAGMASFFATKFLGGKGNFQRHLRVSGIVQCVFWIAIIPKVGLFLAIISNLVYLVVQFSILKVLHELPANKAAAIVAIVTLVCVLPTNWIILGEEGYHAPSEEAVDPTQGQGDFLDAELNGEVADTDAAATDTAPLQASVDTSVIEIEVALKEEITIEIEKPKKVEKPKKKAKRPWFVRRTGSGAEVHDFTRTQPRKRGSYDDFTGSKPKTRKE